MDVRSSSLAIAAALSLATPGNATAVPQASPQLSQVYSQMDRAAATFQSATADLVSEVHTKVGVIDDVEQQTGAMYIKRSGGKVNFGATLKQGGKLFHTVSYDGSVARLYNPSDNSIDTFKAGNNQARFNTILTLGFGSSSKDLQSAWNVTDQGAETIDGVKTEKLDLVSKDPSVRDNFTHVTVWIDPSRDVCVKQIFFSQDGNSKVTNYKNIKLNSRIDEGAFAMPKNARQNPAR